MSPGTGPRLASTNAAPGHDGPGDEQEQQREEAAEAAAANGGRPRGPAAPSAIRRRRHDSRAARQSRSPQRFGSSPCVIAIPPVVGETVTHAVDGQHVARPARVGLDLAAQVLDVRVDGALVRVEGDAVERVEELGTGEDPAGPCGHRGQQPELGRRQVDDRAGHLGAHARQVEDDVAGRGSSRPTRAAGPRDGGPRARGRPARAG